VGEITDISCPRTSRIAVCMKLEIFRVPGPAGCSVVKLQITGASELAGLQCVKLEIFRVPKLAG
jgi:hypothetical protein